MVTKKKKKPTKEEVGIKQKQQAEHTTPAEVAERESKLQVARARSAPTATARRVTATGEVIPVNAPPEERARIIDLSGERAQEEREKGGLEFLEEKEFFQEELPERVELDAPEREGGVGVIGRTPIFGKAGLVSVGLLEKYFKGENAQELETLIQDPETARELALQAIQQDVIDEGLTKSEEFGALVESIPIAGGFIAKYAGGLIESPKENVDTIMSEIDSERERASVIAEKAFTGKLGDPFTAVEQIQRIEDNIIRMEQRIKLLSLNSAELLASADELNRIEEKILRSKERVFIAKQAAAGGIIAPSTDSNIYLTLRELKGRSNAG